MVIKNELNANSLITAMRNFFFELQVDILKQSIH